MSNQKYLMGKLLFAYKKFKWQTFLLLLFSICSLFLSHSTFGATFNLTAAWTLNTEPDIKEYRLYRTDITRTLLGTTLHPNNSYPFTVTVPDGSSGTLLFVITAVDTSNYESADSNPASYSYDLNAPTVTITATDNTATEAGPTTGTFTVSRMGSTSGALTVYYAVSGTATSGSDYNSISSSITIAAGSTTANITVTPINDTVAESDETVIVTLSTNASYTVGSPGSATLTIISDDETLPTVTVTATDNTATEAGPTTGTFTVSRTGSTSGALTVYYAVSGTATSGSDYNSISSSVTIAAGSTTANITVTPINDTVAENDETVIVTLSTNAAYIRGSSYSATVTITSDDVGETINPPSTPSLSSSRSMVTFYRSFAGDSNLYTGTSYQFFTGGSSSNLGSTHRLEYQFSWGDGTYSSWGSSSRDFFSQSHIWALAGTYQVRARARCKIHTDCGSDWSNALSISIQEKPFIHITSPNGGENLAVGASYNITWDSSYLNPSGTIYLFYQFDGAWHPITTLSPTATSFTWTIPRIPEGVTSPAPSASKRSKRSIDIWVGNWANGGWECSDKSDESFRILYDAWVCKISGTDQGGATLLLDEGSFEGYGISLKWGMFVIDGTYAKDAKGKMSGAYTIRDFANAATVLASGSFKGSVDSGSKVLTFNLTPSGGTLSISGVRFISDPVIPGNWTGALSGSVSGTLTSLEIDPYQLGEDLYSNVFGFLGSGSITGGGTINIEGYFYLTSTATPRLNSTNVYGIYRITETINEIGVLTGVLNPTKGTISFTMTSQNGNKYTLSGNAAQ